MSRSRWAVAVLIGGLGLLSGCSTLCDRPLFSRFRSAPAPACCDGPGVPLAEVPVLDSGPPLVAPPGGFAPPAGVALPPGVDVPPPGTNGTIRPAPQVPQAQPVPAQPSRRTPGIFIDRWKE